MANFRSIDAWLSSYKSAVDRSGSSVDLPALAGASSSTEVYSQHGDLDEYQQPLSPDPAIRQLRDLRNRSIRPFSSFSSSPLSSTPIPRPTSALGIVNPSDHRHLGSPSHSNSSLSSHSTSVSSIASSLGSSASNPSLQLFPSQSNHDFPSSFDNDSNNLPLIPDRFNSLPSDDFKPSPKNTQPIPSPPLASASSSSSSAAGPRRRVRWDYSTTSSINNDVETGHGRPFAYEPLGGPNLSGCMQMTDFKPADEDDDDEDNNNNGDDQYSEDSGIDDSSFASAMPALRVTEEDEEQTGLLSGRSQPHGACEKTKKYLREGLRRMPYYIPVLSWLPTYQIRAQGISDLFAGLAVGLMLVPQAISYALIAKVPPIVGLYSGFMPLVIYSLFGSSLHLAAGPEGLLSLLVGSTLENFANDQDISDQPEQLAQYASILALYVGFITFLLGIIRVGFLDNLFSRPILNGFVTAAALIIMVEQLGTFWGMAFESTHTVGKLEQFFRDFTHPNVLALCIGIGLLLLMVAIEYLKAGLAFRWPYLRIFPTTLVIVLVGIGLGAGLQVDRFGVAILGDINGGFPVPILPHFWDYTAFRGLFGTSILISIVGYVEAMAASKLYAAKHNYIVSPNRELVAFGLMDLIGGCFQAYPVFASLTRSSVNDIAGAKTQMAGFITSLVALATILFLMPAFYYLPKVAAAAIVMFAASKLIHVHILIFLWKIQAWIEIGLAAVTLLLTFFLGPEIGILVAMGMSLFIVVKKTTMPHCSLLGFCPDVQAPDIFTAPDTSFRDLLAFPDAQVIPGFLLFRINDELCFANIGSLQAMLKRAERLGSFHAHPTSRSVLETPTKYIILDASNVTGMDAQSLQVTLEMLKDYSERGLGFSFVGLDDDLRQALIWAAVSEYQCLELVRPDIFFPSIAHALSAFNSQPINYSSYTD